MNPEEIIDYYQVIPVNKDSKIVISCLSLLAATIIFLYYTIWVVINRDLILFEIIILGAGISCVLFVFYKAATNLIWSFLGKEIISVSNDVLFLKREMLWFARNRTFVISNISDFNQISIKETSWSSVPLEFKDKCSFSFISNEKSEYFGYNLDENIAKEIFVKLTKHIGDKMSTPPNPALKLTE